MLRPRVALLLVGWAVGWPAAAATPASSASSVAFDVTLSGSQQTVVTGVRTSVDDLGCSVRRSDVERQTLSFASRGSARLVAIRGRATSTRVAVSVAASGTKRRTRTVSGASPECDLAPQTTESSCGPARFAGHAVVALRSFGSVRLSGSPTVRRDTARCGPAVAPARPFLVAAEGRFPAALLTDPTAGRVSLRGDARFTDTLRSGARRVTTVRWTVVLRRLS